MEFRIHRFSDEHIAQVAAIEAKSYRDPWSEAGFREIQILSESSWVAVVGDDVIGYLITQWVLDEIHILNIAVKDEYRRRGAGARLLRMLLDLGTQRGMRDIFLEVRVSNSIAQALYQRFGFSILATRKYYYPDGEDAFVMHRQLECEPEALETALDENIGNEHGD